MASPIKNLIEGKLANERANIKGLEIAKIGKVSKV